MPASGPSRPHRQGAANYHAVSGHVKREEPREVAYAQSITVYVAS
jgi:hypothetical protein